MYTKNELENLINSHANTKVSMHGEIDSNGHYQGHLEGSSTDELYKFVCFIAKARGAAFEMVDYRYGRQNPPTFTCYIQFDTKDIKPKKGFFRKIFG